MLLTQELFLLKISRLPIDPGFSKTRGVVTIEDVAGILNFDAVPESSTSFTFFIDD